jgi:hypothetical protein
VTAYQLQARRRHVNGEAIVRGVVKGAQFVFFGSCAALDFYLAMFMFATGGFIGILCGIVWTGLGIFMASIAVNTLIYI